MIIIERENRGREAETDEEEEMQVNNLYRSIFIFLAEMADINRYIRYRPIFRVIRIE